MHTKIVLIGAGNAQFGCGTLSDIFGSQDLTGCKIMLLDINPTALKRYTKPHSAMSSNTIFSIPSKLQPTVEKPLTMHLNASTAGDGTINF